jgi:hypothetical protein
LKLKGFKESEAKKVFVEVVFQVLLLVSQVSPGIESSRAWEVIWVCSCGMPG